MDEGPRRDGQAPNGAGSEDLDAEAIFARRRAFVASALAGMTLTAASCETRVTGTVTVGQGATSGESVTVVEDAGGQVIAAPCLMVADPTLVRTLSDGDDGGLTEDAGVVIAAPCLMVYAPQDAGARIDASAGPGLPEGVGPRPVPCLNIAPRRDASPLPPPGPIDPGVGAVIRRAGADGGLAVSADAGAAPRRPEVVVPRDSTVPVPCLRIARKETSSGDE
jgi:hypothetical protein